VLETILEPIQDFFDFILIDCNPSLGLLVINALTASNGVLIPIQTEYLAARGANMILSTIETIKRKKLNPFLQVDGVILTMADTRTLITREVSEAVRKHLGNEQRIFDVVIKRSVRFPESAATGQSILAHSPNSQGAEAYRAIAMELLANG
jgi:chromosome partitioning protein